MSPSEFVVIPQWTRVMTVSFARSALLFVLSSVALNASDGNAAQPVRLLNGHVIPGGSCGTGVTTKSERSAIVRRWLVAPGFAGAISLASAVLIRRQLRRVVHQRWRRRGAVLTGILGAVSLMLGLYVLVVGSLHLFNVISLYEPLF